MLESEKEQKRKKEDEKCMSSVWKMKTGQKNLLKTVLISLIALLK